MTAYRSPVERRHALVDGHVDDVAEDQGTRLLAHAAKQVALALVVEVVNGEHRDHQVHQAVGHGSSIRASRTSSIPSSRARKTISGLDQAR